MAASAKLAGQTVLSALLMVVAILTWSSLRSSRGQEPAEAIQPRAGAADLLRAVPFDRITLTDGTVLIVEPVSPRPLPVYSPAEERARRKRAIDNNPVKPFEIGRPGEPARVVEPEPETDPNEDPLNAVKIHLLQPGPNGVRDYRIKRAAIKTIEYFEDLLLKEAERLLLARDYARAFECCLRVRTRNPSWAGLDEQVNRVLFAEGSRALLDGDAERGLRLLRELLDRKRDYPGLLDQLAAAYGKQIERAIAMGLYPRGRRVLHELEEMAPEHQTVRAMRALFLAKATQKRQEAEAAGGPARLDALVEALRIWPALEGAEAQYVQAFAAVPTLDVGVTDVATPLGPWVHSPADARVTPLIYRPILAGDDPDARQGKSAGQLAASVETSDLAHRLLIRVRTGFLWSDGSRPASAIDVAHALIDRTDPHSLNYEARWADVLDRVVMPDETRVEVRLHHAPLKAVAALVGPVGPAHAGIDGKVAVSARERVLVSDGSYRCLESSAERTELRLREDSGTTGPPPGGPAPPRIRRIRETPVAHGPAALRRGDVTLIDHVPPNQVSSLAGTPGIRVGQYAQPVIHLIALDARNPVLRSRALRRGLSYAVDRKAILEDVVLEHSPQDPDAPADGPFPKRSSGDAPGVKPLGFDMLLARMLVAAARKEQGGGRIRLTFEYPAIPEARAVADKLAEAFRIAGVEIVTAELPESRLETELRAGRRFELAYRVVRCRDPIREAGPILCPGYDAPPQADALASAASPRILQLLLELERASDLPSARELVLQIDRESRDELPVIPLWQLVDHYAWRDRLRGPQPVADHLYQGLETWEVRPWIAKDPWDEPTKALSP
ncbi:MAG TPA: ABC transporter substrate-binding protein [Isosphaeraceae bacterium]|nr:ABC transporter substrate-binding protein [Isosphaeraceae bacterium]